MHSRFGKQKTIPNSWEEESNGIESLRKSHSSNDQRQNRGSRCPIRKDLIFLMILVKFIRG